MSPEPRRSPQTWPRTDRKDEAEKTGESESEIIQQALRKKLGK